MLNNVLENTVNLMQGNRLVSKCLDQFNFSHHTKIHILKGVVLSSLTLFTAFAVHIIYQGFKQALEECASSPTYYAGSCMISGVATIDVAIFAMLSFRLKSDQSKPKQKTSPPYVHPENQKKYETILRVSERRRNILLKIAQLESQAPKNQSATDKILTLINILTLIKFNQLLEDKQIRLWKEIEQKA